MQVIYRKTLLEKFDEAVLEAANKGKQIERIDMTTSELATVYDHVTYNSLLSFRRPHVSEFIADVGKGRVTFRGVKLGLQK
jgi:hypothetical protein